MGTADHRISIESNKFVSRSFTIRIEFEGERQIDTEHRLLSQLKISFEDT